MLVSLLRQLVWGQARVVMGPNVASRVQKMRDVGQFITRVSMGPSASCNGAERCLKGSKDAGHRNAPLRCLGQRGAPVVLTILRFQPISFLFDMVVS